MELILDRNFIRKFEKNLKEEERSNATIEKYVRDVKNFVTYAGEGNAVSKETVISYKQHLEKHFTLSSANSMLAAVNRFLRFIGIPECTVKAFRVQKAVCRSKERELTREEYMRLLETARRKGKKQISLIMQTLCATGIRVGELPFITMESLHTRRALVSLKGKSRVVILPLKLCRELKEYAKEKKINSGSIFVTRTGRPIDRSNILHAMKALCQEAGVDRHKVFPHNLRHLFAVTYYNMEKDVCRLADLLGHSNVNTTRIYTLISSEMQEERIENLGLLWQDEKNTA